MLSDLAHPNIIKMRGLSASTGAQDGGPYSIGYFIAMDRLFDTLEGRIKKWRIVSDKSGKAGMGLMLPLFGNRNKAKQQEQADELYQQRLVYAYDLSSAFTYLHRRNIVYRDIKVRCCDGLRDVENLLIKITDQPASPLVQPNSPKILALML